MKNRVGILVVAVTFVIGVALLKVDWSGAISHALYPLPDTIPAIVETPMPDLLRKLETVLEQHAPAVATSLQPGLPMEEILQQEKTAGVKLTDDVRALYAWKNGVSGNAMVGIIPGFRFAPLEEVMEERAIRQAQATGGTIFPYLDLIDTRWVTLFSDGAGGAVYLDQVGGEKYGRIFMFDAEFGFMDCAPSLRNTIAAAIECYEEGAYFWEGEYVDEDIERSIEIWTTYTSTPEEH